MPPQAASPTGRLFTVSEVADHTRVSTTTIYRLIRSGELPALLVGQQYRIPGSALEDFLAGAQVAAN